MTLATAHIHHPEFLFDVILKRQISRAYATPGVRSIIASSHGLVTREPITSAISTTHPHPPHPESAEREGRYGHQPVVRAAREVNPLWREEDVKDGGDTSGASVRVSACEYVCLRVCVCV